MLRQPAPAFLASVAAAPARRQAGAASIDEQVNNVRYYAVESGGKGNRSEKSSRQKQHEFASRQISQGLPQSRGPEITGHSPRSSSRKKLHQDASICSVSAQNGVRLPLQKSEPSAGFYFSGGRIDSRLHNGCGGSRHSNSPDSLINAEQRTLAAQESRLGLKAEGSHIMSAVTSELLPAEQATLNPMKIQFYKTKMCPAKFELGGCNKGSACRFAHSEEERRSLPDLKKTKMCESLVKSGSCPNGAACPYAHSAVELRATPAFAKTKLCPQYDLGHCERGSLCRFAHGAAELRRHAKPSDGSTASSVSPIPSPREDDRASGGAETQRSLRGSRRGAARVGRSGKPVARQSSKRDSRQLRCSVAAESQRGSRPGSSSRSRSSWQKRGARLVDGARADDWWANNANTVGVRAGEGFLSQTDVHEVQYAARDNDDDDDTYLSCLDEEEARYSGVCCSCHSAAARLKEELHSGGVRPTTSFLPKEAVQQVERLRVTVVGDEAGGGGGGLLPARPPNGPHADSSILTTTPSNASSLQEDSEWSSDRSVCAPHGPSPGSQQQGPQTLPKRWRTNLAETASLIKAPPPPYRQLQQQTDQRQLPWTPLVDGGFHSASASQQAYPDAAFAGAALPPDVAEQTLIKPLVNHRPPPDAGQDFVAASADPAIANLAQANQPGGLDTASTDGWNFCQNVVPPRYLNLSPGQHILTSTQYPVSGVAWPGRVGVEQQLHPLEFGLIEASPQWLTAQGFGTAHFGITSPTYVSALLAGPCFQQPELMLTKQRGDHGGDGEHYGGAGVNLRLGKEKQEFDWQAQNSRASGEAPNMESRLGVAAERFPLTDESELSALREEVPARRTDVLQNPEVVEAVEEAAPPGRDKSLRDLTLPAGQASAADEPLKKLTQIEQSQPTIPHGSVLPGDSLGKRQKIPLALPMSKATSPPSAISTPTHASSFTPLHATRNPPFFVPVSGATVGSSGTPESITISFGTPGSASNGSAMLNTSSAEHNLPYAAASPHSFAGGATPFLAVAPTPTAMFPQMAFTQFMSGAVSLTRQGGSPTSPGQGVNGEIPHFGGQMVASQMRGINGMNGLANGGGFTPVSSQDQQSHNTSLLELLLCPSPERRRSTFRYNSRLSGATHSNSTSYNRARADAEISAASAFHMGEQQADQRRLSQSVVPYEVSPRASENLSSSLSRRVRQTSALESETTSGTPPSPSIAAALNLDSQLDAKSHPMIETRKASAAPAGSFTPISMFPTFTAEDLAKAQPFGYED